MYLITWEKIEQPIKYTVRDIIAIKAIMIISIILDSSYILLPWLRKYQVDIVDTLRLSNRRE